MAALPDSLAIDAGARRVRLSPADPSFFGNPYPAYHAIRAACPVFFWEDYGLWCFARHADVAALFRDRRFGREVTHVASRAELGWPDPPDHLQPFLAFEACSMLEREPPVHTRLRRLVNRAFVSREVERLRPKVEALAHRLIDGFAPQGRVELLGAFAEVIPVNIIAELLGVPAEHAPHMLDWSHRMVAMYQFGRSPAVERDAVAATQAFTAFMRALVEARRGLPGADILSLLMAAEAAGDRLSEDELIANAILLLNAGHEATAHAIGNAVVAILTQGLDPGRLFASPRHSAVSVEELLRLDPPLHLFTRYALQPLSIAGVDFKRGERLGLLIGAANRDSAVYPDPDRIAAERLDPERPAVPHLGFGAGIHFCIGAPLARLELEVALPTLFRRLPGLRLAEPARRADGFHFNGYAALELTFSR